MSDVTTTQQLAESYSLDFVDLDHYPVDPSAMLILSRQVAARHQVVPVGRRFGTPVIAVANPGDVFAMDNIRASIGREFIAVVATPEQISRYIDRLYHGGGATGGGGLPAFGAGGGLPAFGAQVPSPPSGDSIYFSGFLSDPGPLPDHGMNGHANGYSNGYSNGIAQPPAPAAAPPAPAPPVAAAPPAPAPPVAAAPPAPPAPVAAPPAPPVAMAPPAPPAPPPAVDMVPAPPAPPAPAVDMAPPEPAPLPLQHEESIAPPEPPLDYDLSGATSEPGDDAPGGSPVAEAPVTEPVAETMEAEVGQSELATAEAEEAHASPPPQADSPLGGPLAEQEAETVTVSLSDSLDSLETVPETFDPAAAPAAGTLAAPPAASIDGVDTAPPGSSLHLVTTEEAEAGMEGTGEPIEEPEGPLRRRGRRKGKGRASDDPSRQETSGEDDLSDQDDLVAGISVLLEDAPPGPPVTSSEAGASETEASEAEAGASEAGAEAPAPSTEAAARILDEAVNDLLDGAHVTEIGEEDGGSLPIDADTLKSLPPLAQVLLTSKRVPWQEMRAALENHADTGDPLGKILVDRHIATEADLAWAMAQEIGLPFVDLDTYTIDYSVATLIQEATARHHCVLPVALDGQIPVVAMANPTDVYAIDDLRTVIGRSFKTVVASPAQIYTFIDYVYNRGKDAKVAEESAAGRGPAVEEQVTDIQSVVEDAPIVRYVNLIILQALNERASDIHVEPTAHDLRIRFRIDGVLHDMNSAPRSIVGAVTTRLKVMADMNVAEHRIPQDGRTSLKMGEREIDLRIACLPTVHGEKMVMRILDKSKALLHLPELGFLPEMLERYEGTYNKPYGTILATGPTGSGKSTTLYGTLHALNSPERNIVTVEDPVEYRIPGICQVQVNVRAGLTFATALRSILRADPDVILIGEIRDKETAVIAAEAALTGHLVLATLHTNGAASTPMRLVEMGIEPYLVTSSLSCVLAQRLARQLCVHCKEAYKPTASELRAAGWCDEDISRLEAGGELTELFRPVGCQACSKTGYRGRIALGEVMLMTEEIEHLIIDHASTEEIERVAISEGMTTLRHDGLIKVASGHTTFEEVLRVVA